MESVPHTQKRGTIVGQYSKEGQYETLKQMR